MTRRNETPRDLLFGLLALANGLIDQDQLVTAFRAWARARGTTLAEILVERGSIDPECRLLLAAMAEKQLKLFGGDTEKSLAAVTAGPSTFQQLASIGDPDLTASLGYVGLPTPSPDATATMSIGTTTGEGQRFRVLRPHAQGGLGAVYVALDGELNREVALKQILDHHADNPLNRARFLIEAEITGGLEHPGIVPVYGLGHYDDGRPYYAMRFIRGDSLKEAIASFHADNGLKQDPGKNSLALRKLLRRFVDVCNAIDYAHGRGVLHRDLKPGNVIVGKYGETLVVDWGLAKAMGKSEVVSQSDERTLMPASSSGSAETMPGSVIGTPAFMSPEQASGNLDDLGPRSDVYSLGATLYCLLTGKVPFEGTSVGTVLRSVQNGEFPRPRIVDPSIDRSLEAVCVKAMALRPEDRYVSARALADDVERWMADEPVMATTDPILVRMGRWARRHKPLVAGLAVLLVTSVVALAFGLSAVRHERDLTQKQRDRAQKALEAESKSRKRTRDVLDDMSSQVVENLMAKQGQKLEPAQEAFLNRSLTSYVELAADPGSGEEERAGAAGAYQQTAVIRRRLGQVTRAIEDQREALKRFDALAAEFPARPQYRKDQAKAHHMLAVLLLETGKLEEAEREERTAIEAQKKIVAENPRDAEQLDSLSRSLTMLSYILYEKGRLVEAIEFQREAASTARQAVEFSSKKLPRQLSLALILKNLGLDHKEMGQFDESRAAYEEAIRLLRAVVAEKPDDPEARQWLGEALGSLGNDLASRGQIDESLRWLGEGITILKSLVNDYPTVPDYRSSLGLELADRAIALATVGRMKEAEADFRENVTIRRRNAADFPSIVRYRDDLMAALGNLGVLFQTTGRPEESEGVNLEAIALNRRLVDEFPATPSYQYSLALKLYNIGLLLSSRPKLPEAEASFLESIALLSPLVARSPKNVDNRVQLAKSLSALGDIRGLARRWEEAEATLRESDAIKAQLVSESPQNLPMLEELSMSRHNLGQAREKLGRIEEAEATFRDSINLYEKLIAAAPKTPHYGYELASAQGSLADLLINRGELVPALALLEKARPQIDAALASNPDDDRYPSERRKNLLSMVRCLARQGDLPAALSMTEQIGHLTGEPSPDASTEARALALLVPLLKKDPVRGVEATAFSDRALSRLRRAAEQGKLDLDGVMTEKDLDAIRSRPDFQVLLRDLAFPKKSFGS